MALLVAANHLEPADAVEIVLAIHRSNPYHINQKIVERFCARIDYRE